MPYYTRDWPSEKGVEVRLPLDVMRPGVPSDVLHVTPTGAAGEHDGAGKPGCGTSACRPRLTVLVVARHAPVSSQGSAQERPFVRRRSCGRSPRASAGDAGRK